MKSEGLDYILSMAVITLLAATAAGLTWLCANGFTIGWFRAYHVLVDALLFLLFFGSASAAFCRLLLFISLIRPGEYPMSNPLFRWWKLFTVIYEFGRGALLPFTTVFAKPLVAKLFGAKIGGNIALGGHLVDPEFITIGESAIIGHDSVITAHTITSGNLILAPVVIGAEATVGVKAVIMSGVQIGARAIITAGAVVPPNTVIPAGELWGGVPARKLKDADTTKGQ
jgi:acetyltransferase-like isoleucine patch superfamily enzyme